MCNEAGLLDHSARWFSDIDMNEFTHAVASLQQLVEQQATKSSEQAREFASQLAQLCSSVSAIEARLDSSQCPVETCRRTHASGKRENDIPLTQSYSEAPQDGYSPIEHDFGPSCDAWADEEASECSPKAGPVSESNIISQVHPLNGPPHAPSIPFITQPNNTTNAASPPNAQSHSIEPGAASGDTEPLSIPIHSQARVSVKGGPGQYHPERENHSGSEHSEVVPYTPSTGRTLHRNTSVNSKVSHTGSVTWAQWVKWLLWDVLQPQSILIQRFKVCILFLCIPTVMAVPFIVSFDARQKTRATVTILDITLCTLEVAFLLDIYTNFRTAYYSPTGAAFQFGRMEVAWNYAKGMLFFDMLAATPVTIVYSIFLKDHPSQRGVLGPYAFMQLSKLLKILNLTQLTAPFEASFGSAQVSFARLVFFFFMIFHATACGFHLLTLINDEGESWIDGEEYDSNEIWSRYVAAMYWTFATISTTGFGDIVPITNSERIFSMWGMFLGLTVFSYFITVLSNILSVINASSVRAANQTRVIDAFVEHHKLPRSMHRQIRSYFDFRHSSTTCAHEVDNALVDDLSPQLRMNVRLFLYADIVAKVPMFRQKSAQFISEIIPRLRSEIFPPGEYVTVQGDVGLKLYFVRSGALQVRIANNNQQFCKAFAFTRSINGCRRITNNHILEDDGALDSSLQIMQCIYKRAKRLANGLSNTSERASLKEDDDTPSEEESERYFGISLAEAEQILDSDYKVVRTLRPGDYFGEHACSGGVKRTASVVSLKYSATLSLSKSALEEVETMFKEGLVKYPARSISMRRLSNDNGNMHAPDELHSNNITLRVESQSAPMMAGVFGLTRMQAGPDRQCSAPLNGGAGGGRMFGNHTGYSGRLTSLDKEAYAPAGHGTEGTNPHVSHAVRRRGRSGEGGDGGAGAGAAPMSSAQGPMSEHVDAAAGPGVYNGDHDFKEGHLSPGDLKNVEVDVSQQPAGHETDFKSLREHAKRV